MTHKKSLKLKPQTRNFSYTRENIRTDDNGQTVVSIAISSEFPYEREWGVEILDHSAPSIDLSRFNNTAAFLVEHNTFDMVGALENVTLGTDRVLRADVKFSRSQRGQDIKNDMVDGIRRHISVGYVIQKLTLEKSEDGQDFYRVTKWMPFEASTVAIPADPTVGVGRAAQFARSAEYEVEAEVEIDSVEAPVETPAAVVEETVAESERNSDDALITNDAPVNEPSHVAEEVVTEARSDEPVTAPAVETTTSDETPVAVVTGRGLAVSQENKEMINGQIETATPVVLTDKERKEYSVGRALFNLVNGKRDGFEHEVSEEIASRMARSTPGFYFPTAAVRGGLNSGLNSIAGEGSEFVFQQSGEFIDLLRAKSVLGKVGAQFQTLPAPLTMPRATGDATATWYDENGNGITASTGSYDQVRLGLRSLGATVPYTKQWTLTAAYSVENILRAQLIAQFATAFESVALQGAAASYQPTGILNATGVGAVVVSGSNGGVPTFAKMVELESTVAAANADIATMAYIATPGVRGILKTTSKGGTNNGFVWEGDEVGGFAAYATTNLPTNLTKGSSSDCHAIVFGDFSQLLLANYGAVEFLMDPYSNKNKAIIELNANMFADVAILQPGAFAHIKDARLS